MGVRSAVVALMILWFGLSPALAAPPPAAAEPVQMAAFDKLLEDYQAVGCLTGAAIGGAINYTMTFALSYWLAIFAIQGCQLGQLVGMGGLLVHDSLTGDDTFGRWWDSVQKQAQKSYGGAYATAGRLE